VADKRTYSEKLKDPLWQRKRLEILNRADWQCGNCGNKNETLHVHHDYYEKGKLPWEYPDEAYAVLCWRCHGEIEEKKLRLLRDGVPFVGIDRVLGYVDAVACIMLGAPVHPHTYEEAEGAADAIGGCDATTLIEFIGESGVREDDFQSLRILYSARASNRKVRLVR